MDEHDRRRVLRWSALAGAVFLALLGVGTVLFASLESEGGEEAFYRAFGALTRVKLVGDPTSSGSRGLAAALTVLGALFYLALVGSGVEAVVVRRALVDTR